MTNKHDPHFGRAYDGLEQGIALLHGFASHKLQTHQINDSSASSTTSSIGGSRVSFSRDYFETYCPVSTFGHTVDTELLLLLQTTAPTLQEEFPRQLLFGHNIPEISKPWNLSQ
jgi:hypothetical protein